MESLASINGRMLIAPRGISCAGGGGGGEIPASSDIIIVQKRIKLSAFVIRAPCLSKTDDDQECRTFASRSPAFPPKTTSEGKGTRFNDSVSDEDSRPSRHLGVNNLPRVVTRPRSDRGLNRRPLDRKSDARVTLRHYWRRGVVVSRVRRTNEVNARRTRLVLGWVTVFGQVYHLGM